MKKMNQYLLVLLIFAILLGVHDVFLYRKFQYTMIHNLNDCIEKTALDMQAENPNFNQKSLEYYSSAIIMDCHHSTVFHYLYPRSQGILIPQIKSGK